MRNNSKKNKKKAGSYAKIIRSPIKSKKIREREHLHERNEPQEPPLRDNVVHEIPEQAILPQRQRGRRELREGQGKVIDYKTRKTRNKLKKRKIRK